MQKTLVIFAMSLLPLFAMAQSTYYLPFEGIIQNDDGTVPANESLEMDFQLVSAVDHSQVVYEEQQTIITNQSGYFYASIGAGTSVTGNFEDIDWSHSQNYVFHITAHSVSNGNTFDLGYAELHPVPLALHAKTIIDSSNWQVSGNNLYTMKNVSIGSADSTFALEMRDNGRMRLQTDQSHLPESALIKMKWPADTAKTAVVWYNKHDDGKIAMVAHYYLHYPTRLHQHFSIESEDASGFIQTRFEFPWGHDTARIETHSADLLINGKFSTGSPSAPSENDIYADTWIHGKTSELNMGTAQLHTGNYPVTIQSDNGPANILIHSVASDKRSVLMLKKGDNEWDLDDNNNLFRITDTNSGDFLHLTTSGRFTFDSESDTSEIFNINGNITVNQHAFICAGPDSYAEYMPAEGTLSIGDIAGIDPSTGKIRTYQAGDFLAGVISSSAARIGNAKPDYVGSPDYALVVITGTVNYNSNQVTTSGRVVYTTDNQKIGVEIAAGKVLLK